MLLWLNDANAGVAELLPLPLEISNVKDITRGNIKDLFITIIYGLLNEYMGSV